MNPPDIDPPNQSSSSIFSNGTEYDNVVVDDDNPFMKKKINDEDCSYDERLLKVLNKAVDIQRNHIITMIEKAIEEGKPFIIIVYERFADASKLHYLYKLNQIWLENKGFQISHEISSSSTTQCVIIFPNSNMYTEEDEEEEGEFNDKYKEIRRDHIVNNNNDINPSSYNSAKIIITVLIFVIIILGILIKKIILNYIDS